VTVAPRFRSFTPLALVLIGLGGAVIAQTTRVRANPADDSRPPETRADTPAITLEAVTFDTFRARVTTAAETSRYVLVDAWATNCGPCKENFPHLVQMHKKYAAKGLAVMSASLDDRDDPKAVAEARKFLKEKGATFPNFLIDEEFPGAYEKFDIGPIPAVFLYGPGGKEIKRFTMEDPDNQFTYEQVEKTVAGLLAGEPSPKDEKNRGKHD
jgi:thiol-disulfide isomerase/thioredoxin